MSTCTIDDTEDMTSLIDIGTDGIYTRYPDVLGRLMRQPGYLPT